MALLAVYDGNLHFSCLGQLVNFFSFERRLMIVAKRSKEEREEERKKDNLKEN